MKSKIEHSQKAKKIQSYKATAETESHDKDTSVEKLRSINKVHLLELQPDKRQVYK